MAALTLGNKTYALRLNLADASRLKQEFGFDLGVVAKSKDPISAIAEQAQDIFRMSAIAFAMSGESDYEAFAASLDSADSLEKLETAFYETILNFFFKTQAPLLLAMMQKQRKAIAETAQKAAAQVESIPVETWAEKLVELSGNGATAHVATSE